jgi:hypothetical protein
VSKKYEKKHHDSDGKSMSKKLADSFGGEVREAMKKHVEI